MITVHCSSSPSGLSSGSTFPIGTTGIHCTASDAAGNASAPLDFAVTVLDPAPFVTVPVSIDDSTSDPSGKTESFAVSATDYLDGTLLASCDHASGSTFPVGATTVVCSATNSSHLITTASFTVTIRYIDATQPVLHGPGDVTATATASTGAAVPFTVTAADPDDAPGVLTLTCDHASGATFSIGVTTVTCHAHDPAGNEAQPLSFTVTVGDAPPLLWLPGDISATTNARGGKVETFAISATDFADGSVPVVCDHASGDAFPVGITTVHCHATNRSGQTTSGSFTVSVTYVDVTPPVFRAPVDLTATATSPAGAAVPFTVTATDPDDDSVTVLCDHPSGATFQIGVTTVTCHAHDAAGNEAQPASFSVTVNDAAPILSLPHDIHDTTNDPSGKAETFSATASDFGDGSVLVVCDHASGATFPVGTTTVLCGALNGAGKSAVGSFSVTVAYVDATAPVLHGPGDLSATATSSSRATVSFGVTASDPDDDAPTVACDHASGASFPIGLTTVTCHAHDPAGNEAQPLSFGVTVSDGAPALSLPADIGDTAHARSGKVATFAASATDFADGPLPVACDHASGEAFPVGATTVHCHATNSSGRTTSGSFTVTIAYVDVTPPAIHGPGDRAATATSSNGAVVSFAVTATDPDDDAPAVACDRASGATFPIGVTTVTCHAHDPAGNEAQPLSFGVTVSDAAPALSLPADIGDTAHVRSGKVATFAASASDFGDGPLPVACDHASGETFPVGATTVHCHATNSSGQTSNGSFTVNVGYVDTSAPVIHTSSDQRVTGTSAAGATVFYTATADDPDDNSAALTLVCGPLQSGATFPIGVSTVTCTASDPAGNHGTPAAFTVTVDPPPPPLPATVSVAVSGPVLGRVGEDVSFSVVVKSASETASTGIEVHAQVPNSASLVATSGAATCSGQTEVVCRFGTLAAGSSATQTIVLRPAQSGSLTLFATISGEGAAGSSTASTAVLDPATPPPPPPPPTQPQTFNAISTGTVLVNGQPQPSDTLFLVVSGDHIDLNGELAITTFAGNSGLFSNVPFTAQRRTSAVGVIGGAAQSFTVNTTGAGTTMTLAGGDFKACKTSRRVAANEPKTVVRQLWGKAKGQFTTRAKYSSATIRGTTWGVQDRCDGSFTTAVDDFVTVVDFTAKKTLTLKPGETYLAAPPRAPADVFKPPTQTAAAVRSQGLLWAGRRFRTKAQLSAWLVSNGSSWRAFAAKYPALAKALASRGK